MVTDAMYRDACEIIEKRDASIAVLKAENNMLKEECGRDQRNAAMSQAECVRLLDANTRLCVFVADFKSLTGALWPQNETTEKLSDLLEALERE
jgi:hypothetical protein